MKKNKQNKNENLTLLLGRPESTRRPAKHTPAYASAAQKRRGPGQAPASARQLTSGARTTERQTGEEERTAA